MSALRAHIVAARAYEAAWMEKVRHFQALGDIGDERKALTRVYIHRRAAEIMEAEQAAEYNIPADRYPRQMDGA